MGFVFPVLGQSVVSKQISAQQITEAEFRLPWVYQLEIVGLDSIDQVDLLYDSYGEYKTASTIIIRTIGRVLYADEVSNPNFELHHDKLSVHKQYATKAKLLVPSDLEVRVMVDNCRVEVKGNLNRINLQLNTGFCSFEANTFNSSIESLEANICIVNSQVNVDARSKYGLVLTTFNPEYSANLVIGTTLGNVYN